MADATLTALAAVEQAIKDQSAEYRYWMAGEAKLTAPAKRIYVASFSAVAITAAQDCFSILAGSARCSIRYVSLSQYSDFGDAAAEILSLTIVRGNTTAGSGGSAFTPLRLRASTPGSGSTVRINDTTVATGGTAEVLVAEAYNVQAGYFYVPPEEERIWIEPRERVCVRITIPADSLTSNGTLVFEEHP